jgi:N-(2-amino-2-carboxyethyl)-L-glutamate synthase
LLRTPELYADLSVTPVSRITVEYRGETHQILLKHECQHPTGSVKARTAVGLLRVMDRMRPLQPGTVVVESTSGNLGLALARLLIPRGCRLIAVIDPKTPEATKAALADDGVELRCVTELDDLGGYLLTRLRAVRELCEANPSYRQPDQYNNPANPLIHRLTTGPEIVAQGGEDLDTVYVAVSSGGTLAGVGAHLRSLARRVRLVAVDLAASQVTGPARACRGRRLIPDIGASRPSAFLREDSYDDAVAVGDADAIALCQVFHTDTGVRLGGSTGCVLYACVCDLASQRPPRQPLCLCADDGDKYAESLYDGRWLAQAGILEEVAESIGRLRGDGLAFQQQD